MSFDTASLILCVSTVRQSVYLDDEVRSEAPELGGIGYLDALYAVSVAYNLVRVGRHIAPYLDFLRSGRDCSDVALVGGSEVCSVVVALHHLGGTEEFLFKQTVLDRKSVV